MDGDSASKQPLQRFTRDVYSVRRRTMMNDKKEKKQTNEKIQAQRHCYVCGFIRSVILKLQRYGRKKSPQELRFTVMADCTRIGNKANPQSH